MNRILREQLTGIRVVRAFVRERIEEQRFRGANTDIMDVGRRVGTLFITLFPLFMLVLNVTVIGVIWFGAIEVERGRTSRSARSSRSCSTSASSSAASSWPRSRRS